MRKKLDFFFYPTGNECHVIIEYRIFHHKHTYVMGFPSLAPCIRNCTFSAIFLRLTEKTGDLRMNSQTALKIKHKIDTSAPDLSVDII